MISELSAIALALLQPKIEKQIEQPKVVKVATANVSASWNAMASWYGIGDGYNGRQAADGSIFNAYELTAAEPNLPFGTRVRVTNLDTGLSVVVRITDRGGFTNLGRGIDLSYEAARQIGGVDAGVFPVKLEVLE